MLYPIHTHTAAACVRACALTQKRRRKKVRLVYESNCSSVALNLFFFHPRKEGGIQDHFSHDRKVIQSVDMSRNYLQPRQRSRPKILKIKAETFQSYRNEKEKKDEGRSAS
jgi:hypothetical protein